MLQITALARPLLALILGVGLLAGSIESHTEHDLTHAPALATESVAAVCHPKQALHIEASEMVTVPACPACLLHLDNLIPNAGLGRTHIATMEPDSTPSPSTPSPTPAWRLHGPSRAPPPA